MELGYLDCSYKKDKFKIQQNKDLFNEVYLRILNQWSQDLYTPKSLLENIKKKILLSYQDNTSFYVYLNLKNLPNIVKNDYKHYEKFTKVYEKYKEKIIKNDFYILIIITSFEKNNQFNQILNYAKKLSIQTYQNINSKKIYQIFKNYDFPIANTFTRNSGSPWQIFSSGCLIILNRDKLNFQDQKQVQLILDHQLNHYFDILDYDDKLKYDQYIQKKYSEIIDKNQKKDLIKILEKTASDAGYEIYSTDFINHFFKKSQFNEMCSDVCNSISFYLKEIYKNFNQQQLFYKWIQLSSSNFILSKQFKQINYNLQNALLFSYSCRLLSSQNWKILKQHVKVQLQNPKLNFLKSSINWIKEFFHKI